jgi:broad specificity phosphatase PhoE
MLADNEFYLSLIRHGQSTTNMNPDLMGQEADTPLSPRGEWQANRLAVRLEKESPFDFVYASTYKRAQDTARIALPRTSMQWFEELREYSAGDWTGVRRQDAITDKVKLRMGSMEHGFLPPNGESLHQVERRAGQWLEEHVLYNSEVQNFARLTGRPANVAVFSHGMTIKCLLHYVMGFDKTFTWKVTIDNTSISKLYFGKDGWRLLSINDCAHLQG